MDENTETGPGAGQRREPADPGPQDEGSREKARGSEVRTRPGPLRRPGAPSRLRSARRRPDLERP